MAANINRQTVEETEHSAKLAAQAFLQVPGNDLAA